MYLSIYKCEILKVLNLKCPVKYKSKYSNEYFLDLILLVLTELQNWSSIQFISTQSKYKYHYKTIQDKHCLWSKLNIYEEVYFNILKNYNLQNNVDTLFIDTSDIYNKNGIECIGFGGQNKKKKKSLLSVICDKNKNVYACILVESTENIKKVKTFPHDINTVISTLDSAIDHGIKIKNTNLVGDKGYISKDLKNKLKERNINFVYPSRKNAKIKTPIDDKIHLKNRYVIENLFADIKKYNRICMRKDILKCTYIGFVYLALMQTTDLS